MRIVVEPIFILFLIPEMEIIYFCVKVYVGRIGALHSYLRYVKPMWNIIHICEIKQQQKRIYYH